MSDPFEKLLCLAGVWQPDIDAVRPELAALADLHGVTIEKVAQSMYVMCSSGISVEECATAIRGTLEALVRQP